MYASVCWNDMLFFSLPLHSICMPVVFRCSPGIGYPTLLLLHTVCFIFCASSSHHHHLSLFQTDLCSHLRGKKKNAYGMNCRTQSFFVRIVRERGSTRISMCSPACFCVVQWVCRSRHWTVDVLDQARGNAFGHGRSLRACACCGTDLDRQLLIVRGERTATVESAVTPGAWSSD